MKTLMVNQMTKERLLNEIKAESLLCRGNAFQLQIKFICEEKFMTHHTGLFGIKTYRNGITGRANNSDQYAKNYKSFKKEIKHDHSLVYTESDIQVLYDGTVRSGAEYVVNSLGYREVDSGRIFVFSVSRETSSGFFTPAAEFRDLLLDKYKNAVTEYIKKLRPWIKVHPSSEHENDTVIHSDGIDQGIQKVVVFRDQGMQPLQGVEQWYGMALAILSVCGVPDNEIRITQFRGECFDVRIVLPEAADSPELQAWS